jgi:hypothetical protein
MVEIYMRWTLLNLMNNSQPGDKILLTVDVITPVSDVNYFPEIILVADHPRLPAHFRTGHLVFFTESNNVSYTSGGASGWKDAILAVPASTDVS